MPFADPMSSIAGLEDGLSNAKLMLFGREMMGFPGFAGISPSYEIRQVPGVMVSQPIQRGGVVAGQPAAHLR
jgi:hypothetical protein